MARVSATDLMYWTGEGDAATSGTIPWSSLAFLGANAGQAGQVLTSAGSNAAPYWSNMPTFDYDPETKILIIS